MDERPQCSYNSQSSTTSSVPQEFFDPDFIIELEIVDEFFFSNIQISNSDNESESADDDLNDNLTPTDSVPFDQFDLLSSQTLELSKQNDFKSKGCSCVRLYHGQPCSGVVDWQELVNYRESCLEKSKDELDMIIKVQLFHNRNSGSTTDKLKSRERNRQSYYFHGHKICRDTFAFAHGLQYKIVDRIAKSLDNDGLNPRVHGNVGKAPKHALTISDVQNIKSFLTIYAHQNGVLLPGRMSNFRNEKYVLLPSDKNKADIHLLYCEATETNNFRKVCLSEFKKIWLEQLPYLLVMKPSTDLCHKCQNYVNSIANSGNLTEEEKSVKLEIYQSHLDKVKSQRDHYRQQCETAQQEYKDLPADKKIRGQSPSVNNGSVHYSFDYAQQVFYPHYAQQVGPMYFKTPRKCGCFGVCCESSGSQIFYLVDEEIGASVGKGANSVVSMLHHHFEHLGYGEKRVSLHMDNCSGQNKNNAVIGYGMWRTMMGLHEEFEYSLMEAGHTKFGLSVFGRYSFLMFNVRWRHTTAETLEEIATSVSQSSRNGHNIPQLVNDPTKPVVFYDWTAYLKQFFKPLTGLKKYHHFRMSSLKPGIIFVKEYSNNLEIEINIFKNENVILTGTFHERVNIAGLDAKRQWYLQEEVGPLCSNTSACPMPTVPKPQAVKSTISKKKN